MLTHNSTTIDIAQSALPESVETKRKSAARAHEVSGSMMPCLRRELIDSLRAGRELKQAAAEYKVGQSLALWLYVRAELRRMDLRLQAVEDRVLPATRLRLVA